MTTRIEAVLRRTVSGLTTLLVGSALCLACGGSGRGMVDEKDRIGTTSEALGSLSVSGTITDANGNPLAGVTIQLSGSSQATATTDASGTYAFTGLSAGSYSVQPSLSGCSFTPSVANLNNLTASATADFSGQGASCGGTAANSGATAGSLTISGVVANAAGLPVPGVKVSLNGGTQAWRTTTANGLYSFQVNSGSYSLQPSGPCAITPSVANLNNVSTSQTQNFVAGSACVATDLVTVPNVGMISGTRTATMRSFKGIPYGAPPVGPLRWMPPQKAAPVTGVLDATKFGSACPQGPSTFGTASTDEDCLFLNVYAPVGSGPYPVMFWIYGGSFVFGDSSLYNPSSLVAQGVVVVTINYRLGVLGFLASTAIDNGAGVASTNYGLLDQQLALRWVQDNIAAFNGDNTNVTLFGESAGGFSVHSQLVMSNAHGLFQKAIVESGAYGDTNQLTLASAQTQGDKFASSVNCPSPCSADFLRGLSVSGVLAGQAAVRLQTFPALPPADGTVIPTGGVGMALGSGNYEKVPVIEGSNHDEFAFFVGLYLIRTNMALSTQTDYVTATAATLDVSSTDAMNLIAQYPLANYMMDPSLALTAAGTDFAFACPSRAAAIQFAPNSPTYVYEFSDQNAPEVFLAEPKADPSFPYHAAHASELQFIWNLQLSMPASTTPLTADEQALSATMVKYWTQFAKSGDPNSSGSPTWPAYTTANDSILTLNTPAASVQVTTGFKAAHKCQ
jgi:para-nitrobenzyl esterase